MQTRQGAIIVTGAAGGIGEETARLLASCGDQIVLTDVNRTVETIAEDIRKAGGNAIAVVADVTSEGAVETLIAAGKAQFGSLAGAVNCAGIEQHLLPLAQLGAEQWNRVLSVNLTGVFYCMKHQIKAMIDNGGGSVVNIVSALGVVALPKASEYVAAKHGLAGLTKAAAIDYAKHNIRVNGILPGVIETPMLARNVDDPAAAQLIQMLRAAHPIGRFGKPREIAETCRWLLSDAASFVTGALIPVDGGYTAW